MTQLVAVQTDFRDIDQMAHGLAGRVHATHVILPAGEAVDEGEWAHFEIVLQDGSAGLAGLGRCVTVVDNGEERMPHQRFDVVIDSLQFDTDEQRVFDHVLALHGEPGDEIEQVADADAESLPPVSHDDSSFEVSAEFTGSVEIANSDVSELSSVNPSSVGYDEGQDEERTMIASAADIHAFDDEPVSVPAPGGEENDVEPPALPMSGRSVGGGGGYSHGHGGASTAHAIAPAAYGEELEEPVSGERIAPPVRAVNGTLFSYANGIPIPSKPPRPQLDATQRVTPAPRPASYNAH
jgi:hypothetical protein